MKTKIFSGFVAGFVLMAASVPSAFAWDVVFDPSNYVQTTTTAGAAVKSEAYQDTNIAYQYQMMLNQLKQATNLNPTAMVAEYNQISSDISATTKYVNTLTSLYGQIQSDAQYMSRIQALVTQSGKSPTQWLSDMSTLLKSGDSMARSLFQQGNDVMSHIQTLAARRQQIQSQLGLTPTQQATAQLTTHMLDIVASQNEDMLKMMATKMQSDSITASTANQQAQANNTAQAALQLQIATQRAQFQSQISTSTTLGQ
jgi:type IV secretion system protein TrbJ